MRPLILTLTLLLGASPALAETFHMGPRPLFLVDQMEDGPLKEKLASCAGDPVKRTLFSIGHRGAPMQFPEHTVESNIAAARMGAGILECDVAVTKDGELVCRHAQNDLHTTTNILSTDLATNCAVPFSPASGGTEAVAECRTSDITLAEFRTLTGKMDAADKTGTTVEAYMDGTAGWRTDLYAAQAGTLLTHAESIRLFRDLGAKFTPELKAYTQGPGMLDYDAVRAKIVQEYIDAGVPPADVWLQSFQIEDVQFWIENFPEFGAQAVYLDASYNIPGWNPMDPATFQPTMSDLRGMGINYIAPPLWVLVTVEDGKIVPSAYAAEAKAAGLKMITWTIERSGPLKTGGGWYYQSITDVVTDDGAMYELIHVLAQDVGVEGIFSDWPATVSYYASCMGLD